jgi:hypothetical protein
MDPLSLTISQFAVSFVIVATLVLVLWLIADFVRKPGSISGETYLYIKPSDTDFFDMITEFRNDIPGK